jgi:hypothetical protein
MIKILGFVLLKSRELEEFKGNAEARAFHELFQRLTIAPDLGAKTESPEVRAKRLTEEAHPGWSGIEDIKDSEEEI